MRKASFVVSPYFLNNRIFSTDPAANRDDCLSAYRELKKQFLEKGVELATQDIHPIDAADIVIYVDMPAQLPPLADKAKSHLIISEAEIIIPRNFIMSAHNRFAKIFTFYDELVDGDKYIKLNSSRSFHDDVPTDLTKKTKFCTLIAGNHRSTFATELYSKRVEGVRWFEQHHPEQFDLYGRGWDRAQFYGVMRPLNRIPLARKLFAEKYPSYRGAVDSKFAVLQQYKFAFAFENASDVPGYITGDKIFDPMQAGCIPIYWGAPNITDYVPANCFIDWRQFTGWPALYDHLQSLSDADLQAYLENIKNYISREAKVGPFSSTAYAKAVVDALLK